MFASDVKQCSTVSFQKTYLRRSANLWKAWKSFDDTVKSSYHCLEHLVTMTSTLRCLINGEVKINWGLEIFIKSNKWGSQNKQGGGQNFKISINISNISQKCLIFMLNLKVSKQRSDNSNNKVIIKRVSKISIN